MLFQLLVESLLLSLAGGGAGLFLAVVISRALLQFVPAGSMMSTLHADPDPRILAFNAVLAILTGLLFGLAPAWQAIRLDLWTTLKDAGGGVTNSGGSVGLRKGLVMAQVAFSFLLLAGAGLFVKTLANLKDTRVGFQGIDNLITFQLDPALNGYTVPRLMEFYRRLLDETRAIPGVKAAGYAAVPVLAGSEWDSGMGVEGHQAKDGEDMQAFMNAVSPSYFAAMGVPLLGGRDFDDRDRGSGKESHQVAIVNRAFATHFFGQGSPIGRHIGFGTGPKSKLDIEIVGEVENSLYEGPRDGVHRQAFIPLDQSEFPMSAVFYVRTAVDSSQVFSAVRRRIAGLDPAMPVFEMKTLASQLDQTLAAERLVALLSAAFGVLATLLAALGLYGVMAFVVVRRTREIGLRMALGAPRGLVVWMVLREALALLGLGLAVGVPAAFLLSRLVSAQLYGVKPDDLSTALIALLILSAVAAGAGFLPARRASAIDPIRALRYE